MLLLVFLPVGVSAQHIKKHKRVYLFKYDIEVPVDSSLYKLDSITTYADSSKVHLRFTLKTKDGEPHFGGSISVKNTATSPPELNSNGLYIVNKPNTAQMGMPDFNGVFALDLEPPVSCVEVSGWLINRFSLCGFEFKPGRSYHFLINNQRRNLPLLATIHSQRILTQSEIDTIVNDLDKGVEPELKKQKVCYILIWI